MTDIEQATFIRDEIVRLKKNVAFHALELGALFKQIRDKKLYKQLDYDTFNEFLGDPEIGMGRSTAYFFIELHERYVLNLDIPKERLAAIGTKRLALLAPVVSKEVGDLSAWLDRAEVLSCSDLKIEVNEALGRPNIPIKSLPETLQSTISAGPLPPYAEYVKTQSCLLHEKADSEGHHFPRTRGAGADDWKKIPLCRRCHTEYHQDPKEFLWENRVKIFDFFYGLIYKLYGEEKDERN